ncbi:hypothetical protein E2C01_009229 [Portunus trituberculatus]|uniref:Uncharacterized protein n=1 Tax=Portunus trituberculatus TaxID=210409 RepID=A0A5B7D5E0_PORTR|nr:hypothetical protein [Portunus trituberculatus]
MLSKPDKVKSGWTVPSSQADGNSLSLSRHPKLVRVTPKDDWMSPLNHARLMAPTEDCAQQYITTASDLTTSIP